MRRRTQRNASWALSNSQVFVTGNRNGTMAWRDLSKMTGGKVHLGTGTAEWLETMAKISLSIPASRSMLSATASKTILEHVKEVMASQSDNNYQFCCTCTTRYVGVDALPMCKAWSFCNLGARKFLAEKCDLNSFYAMMNSVLLDSVSIRTSSMLPCENQLPRIW